MSAQQLAQRDLPSIDPTFAECALGLGLYYRSLEAWSLVDLGIIRLQIDGFLLQPRVGRCSEVVTPGLNLARVLHRERLKYALSHLAFAWRSSSGSGR